MLRAAENEKNNIGKVFSQSDICVIDLQNYLILFGFIALLINILVISVFGKN